MGQARKPRPSEPGSVPSPVQSTMRCVTGGDVQERRSDMLPSESLLDGCEGGSLWILEACVERPGASELALCSGLRSTVQPEL